MTDHSALASLFRRFADVECGRSPLYRTLANGMAEDEEMLALAAQATSSPRTNLFLAAVHYILLSGTAHALGRFYPSLGGSYADGEPVYPVFRDFCLQHREAILPLLQTRRVQTNEVARASVLLPAFGLISARTFGAPLALIEVGASAGLLLLFDRYTYDYGTGGTFGCADSPVQLQCSVRGDQAPPVPAQWPTVAMRVGIDLFPIDVRDPQAALWLKALVWADQVERFKRLSQAIDLVAAQPPELIGGDGLEALPAALAQVPGDAVPVVFHCHTLNQFRPEDRERFAGMLAEASVGRTLYRVALEYAGGEWPELRLQLFADGALVTSERLGRYQAHGDWVEWSLQSLS